MTKVHTLLKSNLLSWTVFFTLCFRQNSQFRQKQWVKYAVQLSKLDFKVYTFVAVKRMVLLRISMETDSEKHCPSKQTEVYTFVTIKLIVLLPISLQTE